VRLHTDVEFAEKTARAATAFIAEGFGEQIVAAGLQAAIGRYAAKATPTA
jgi:hypothetical protein